MACMLDELLKELVSYARVIRFNRTIEKSKKKMHKALTTLLNIVDNFIFSQNIIRVVPD
jgi:hypothetical protein